MQLLNWRGLTINGIHEKRYGEHRKIRRIFKENLINDRSLTFQTHSEEKLGRVYVSNFLDSWEVSREEGKWIDVILIVFDRRDSLLNKSRNSAAGRKLNQRQPAAWSTRMQLLSGIELPWGKLDRRSEGKTRQRRSSRYLPNKAPGFQLPRQ